MDDNDSDIDSQMVLHSDIIDTKNDNDSFVNKLTSRGKKLGKHPLFEFINKRNQSLSYSIFMLVIYFIKFIATVIIISVDPTNCQANVDVWLAIMCSHDCLLLIARSLILSCIISKMNKTAPVDEQSDVCSEIINSQDRIRELQMRLSNSESKRRKHLLNSYDKRQKAGSTLLSCTLVLFLGLFVWGQYIYYGPYPSCGRMPTLKKIIFLINVFFGYFYICLPLIFLLFGCISLSWLFVGNKCLKKLSRSTGKGKVIPESMKTSASKERYSADSKTRSDCGICFFEYDDGEVITKLDCDESHAFHEICLDRWMQTRNSCPICGKKIDIKVKQDKDNKKRDAILVLFE